MRGDMKAIAGKAIVPLRERPTSGTALDDELLYGMVVEVLEEAADEEEGEAVPWVSVRTPYRYTGYCKKEDLILDQARVAAWEAGELCVVMQGFADVLDEPRVQGVCLESLARGGRLLAHREEATEEAGWVCVELADGGRGYTKEKFLGPCYSVPFTADEDAFRKRLVEMAKGYLGAQYRWGGKSTLGIDCSGLTSMCYMLCGVYIYRNAGYVDGFAVHEIPAAEKKPGDLLYFPGHIAMYIGDDRYIHSTGRNGDDGVVINSLNPAHEDFREDLLNMLERAASMF
jgi:hypothetical protein|nr:C40 family peptidase [uncultured Acetatifactor sp.]